MEKDIESYFTQYFHGMNSRLNKASLINVVDEIIIDVVEEIIKYSEMKLSRVFSQKVYLGMAIHIEASIERIKKNKKIINPQLHKIRIDHNVEFNVALECLKMIEKNMDINMPIDEAGFLTMFFILDNETEKKDNEKVGVIVIAHGNSTATSMVEVSNQLLGTKHAVGINAPLDESPQSVLTRVKEYIKSTNNKKGFILLVDMGSLSTFGEIINKELNIPVRVVQLVSTLHVIEAARKAILGYDVDEIYRDIKNIERINDEEDEKEKFPNEIRYAILTACTTGEGSAIAIKKFLEKHLKFDNRIFEIVPINIVGKEDINQRLKRIGKEKEIICIICPFDLKTNIPQYGLDEVLNLKAIKRIQEVIDVQNTYLKMGETLKHHLKNVDGMRIFEDIKRFIALIKEGLKIEINTDMLIGIVLHIGCMIDRLKGQEAVVEYASKNEYIRDNQKLYCCIKNSLKFLNKKYEINITDDEICFIMNFFNANIDTANSVLA
jgi:transcriptional regulatory protein LevR